MNTYTTEELQNAASTLSQTYDLVSYAVSAWNIRYMARDLYQMGMITRDEWTNMCAVQRRINAIYQQHVRMVDEQEKMNEVFNLLDESVAHPTTEE